MPGEEAECLERRHADALVTLCAGRLSSDPDPDRASVVVHARLQDLREGGANAEIEGGGVVPPEAVERLLCDSRIQTIVEDKGEAVAVRSMRREPPAWMVRQVRYRDRSCRFPGCEARRYTQAHHIRFWSQGGRTELPNLVLLCGFHHRLVHEHGWSLRRVADGQVRWFWPDGRPHRLGDSPEQEEQRARSRRLRETAEHFGFILSDPSLESWVIAGIGPGRPRTRPAEADRRDRPRLLEEARSGSPP
jgi:hypothetical protein